jgi:hypothetical protein
VNKSHGLGVASPGYSTNDVWTNSASGAFMACCDVVEFGLTTSSSSISTPTWLTSIAKVTYGGGGTTKYQITAEESIKNTAAVYSFYYYAVLKEGTIVYSSVETFSISCNS